MSVIQLKMNKYIEAFNVDATLQVLTLGNQDIAEVQCRKIFDRLLTCSNPTVCGNLTKMKFLIIAHFLPIYSDTSLLERLEALLLDGFKPLRWYFIHIPLNYKGPF